MPELEILAQLKQLNLFDMLLFLILMLVIRVNHTKLLSYVDKVKSSAGHLIDFDEHVRIHHEANLILENLRETTRSDTTFVLQFHNGGENLSGVPFGKFSMTHESFTYGLRSIMKDFQSVPLPMILHLIVHMQKQGTYIINDIDALASADVQTHYLFNNYCIRSLAIEPLTNVKGTMTGLLCVADILRPHEMSAERVALIKTAGLRLSSLIGAAYVQK